MGAVRIEKDTLVKILDCCIVDDCDRCPNAYNYGGIAACEAITRGSVSIPYAIMRETIEALKEQEPSKPKVIENVHGAGCVLEMHPIVLCKNCKHGESVKNAKGEPMIECALLYEGWLKEPDWFCADGERKAVKWDCE